MDISEINAANSNRHPWELSRSEKVLSLVKDRLAGKFCADIGAGDLFFTKKLLPHAAAPVYAVDTAFDSFTPGNTQGIALASGTASLPDNMFDLIFLLDVLEHVEDTKAFLTAVKKKLKEGGELVVTVPAGPCLFSRHDEALRHFRRYTVEELSATLRDAGFAPRELFPFYTSLFFARAAEKLLDRTGIRRIPRAGAGGWKYGERHVFTRAVSALLNLDFLVGRICGKRGIAVPGLSLGALCRKKSS